MKILQTVDDGRGVHYDLNVLSLAGTYYPNSRKLQHAS